MAPAKGEPNFWIGLPLAKRRKAKACAGSHIAFMAANRKAVDAFYKAAIKAGGKDNGKPGLRPNITPITTAPSSSIRRVTRSKPAVTSRNKFWPEYVVLSERKRTECR